MNSILNSDRNEDQNNNTPQEVPAQFLAPMSMGMLVYRILNDCLNEITVNNKHFCIFKYQEKQNLSLEVKEKISNLSIKSSKNPIDCVLSKDERYGTPLLTSKVGDDCVYHIAHQRALRFDRLKKTSNAEKALLQIVTEQKPQTLLENDLEIFKKSELYQVIIQNIVHKIESVYDVFRLEEIAYIFSTKKTGLWADLFNFKSYFLDASSDVFLLPEIESITVRALLEDKNNVQTVLGSDGPRKKTTCHPHAFIFVSEQQEIDHVLKNLLSFYLEKRFDEILNIAKSIRSSSSLIMSESDILISGDKSFFEPSLLDKIKLDDCLNDHFQAGMDEHKVRLNFKR